MNNIDFISVLFDNISLYLIDLTIVLLIYLFILRKYFNSILDPMFLCIVTNALASTIPIYLYQINYSNIKYFIYFICAELFYWIGFSINYKKNSKFKSCVIIDEKSIAYNLYILFFISSIILKLISYILLGIPILLDNPHDIYINAGGLAIINKLEAPLSFYCLVYSFNILNKKRLLGYSYIIFSIITGILSGSKSFLLGICTAYFVYKSIFREERIVISKNILIIILSSPILILLISGNNSDLNSAISSYFFRIVAYGDIYWNSFPYETIENIHIDNPLKHLFSGILGPFRLIDYEKDAIPIGQLLYWEIMPIEYHDTMGGPNARPVVLSYILFKFWGITTCYLFGSFMAYLLTHLKRVFPKGILSAIFIGYIYVSFISITTDPVMAFNKFFIIFLFIFMIIASIFIVYTNKKIIIRTITKDNRSLMRNNFNFLFMFLSSIVTSMIVTFYFSIN